MRNLWLAAGALIATGTAAVLRPSPDNPLARIVAETEQLNTLREGLARQFEGATSPTERTFQRVCQPVGAEARRLAEETGWKVQQLAVKYRNPVNRADPEAERFIHQLAADSTVQGLWIRTEMDGQPGIRYFRRIAVRNACMPCHGTRDSRPRFIEDGYPRDRAYNFEVGDLRGVYSVFVPDGR